MITQLVYADSYNTNFMDEYIKTNKKCYSALYKYETIFRNIHLITHALNDLNVFIELDILAYRLNFSIKKIKEIEQKEIKSKEDVNWLIKFSTKYVHHNLFLFMSSSHIAAIMKKELFNQFDL